MQFANDAHPHPARHGRQSVEPELERRLGRRIREARKARGITLKVLAARLGVSYQQVQKYEKGDNRISVSTLLLISRVLGVPAIALLDDMADAA